jgi:hypothetical protein
MRQELDMTREAEMRASADRMAAHGSAVGPGMARPFPTMWHTSKILEQRFRSACSMVVETMLAEEGDKKDDALREHLNEFDRVKREQVELCRLTSLYAQQLRALQETEYAVGMMIGTLGMHESRRSMNECLSTSADLLKRSSKQKEELIRASESLGQTLHSFLSTAVEDMQTSKDRYDKARRSLQAAEDTFKNSRSAVIDPARRQLLQVQLDEGRKLFTDISGQLTSKIRLLQHHRNQLLCKNVSHLSDCAKTYHLSCASSWSTWIPYAPNEQDAADIIEERYSVYNSV